MKRSENVSKTENAILRDMEGERERKRETQR